MPETPLDALQQAALQSALLELMRCAAIKGPHAHHRPCGHDHGCSPVGAPCHVPTDYLYEIARLQLEYYGRLLKFGIEVTDSILRKQAWSCDPCAAKTIVKVTAKAGELVTGSFRVRNPSAHPVRLRLDAGPFRTSGQVPFYADIDFHEAERCIDPCEEIDVHFGCQLTKQFKPGSTYESDICIAGYPAHTVCLQITVLLDKSSEAEKPSDPSRPAQRRKTRRARG